MRAYPWFRLWNDDYLNDLKVRHLSDSERLLLIELWCLANQSPIRGSLYVDRETVMTTSDIAFRTRRDEVFITETITKFEGPQFRFLERDSENAFVVRKFLERQYDHPSDYPEAQRKKKQKQRLKNLSRIVPTDDRQNPEVYTDTDTDQMQKKRESAEKKIEMSPRAEAIINALAQSDNFKFDEITRQMVAKNILGAYSDKDHLRIIKQADAHFPHRNNSASRPQNFLMSFFSLDREKPGAGLVDIDTWVPEKERNKKQ